MKALIVQNKQYVTIVYLAFRTIPNKSIFEKVTVKFSVNRKITKSESKGFERTTLIFSLLVARYL